MNTKQSHAHGTTSVIAALVGNVFIMIIKWVGFFYSGSGSLFSEAIHSVADVFNQALLMVGIRKSQKPSNSKHPYGFGNERFFWALISACSIFFVGAGVTVYHGITSIAHPEGIHVNNFVYIILIISFLIEGGTFFIALFELKKSNKEKKFAKLIRDGDPTTVAVLLEDGIAVLGVTIAMISIFLTKITQNQIWDSAGSILIGVTLGIMAVLLIAKNRSYLMKKSMPEEIKEKIIEILEAQPAIEKVMDFKSVVLDVEKYHIKCEVEFNGSALMHKMYRPKALKSEYEEVRHDYNEFLRFCVDYADRVPRMIGNSIDDVEEKIKKEVPQVRHIDIEVN
jgi:zinc transporter 9